MLSVFLEPFWAEEVSTDDSNMVSRSILVRVNAAPISTIANVLLEDVIDTAWDGV